MEKEQQAESMTTIPIKPEYTPSEIYGSEAPPAYQRPKSTPVQVAKIVAVTIILVSFILGGFILASSYVTANATFRQLEQEMQLLSDTADRFQAPPQAEALIQEEPIQKQASSDVLRTEEKVKEVHDNGVGQDNDENSAKEDTKDTEPLENNDSSENDSSEEANIGSQFPFDIDQIIEALVEKNQRSKMNCIVEKKRAEEVVDHQPKFIRLPFGVNLTTDPRYEHLTGERMVIVCESGKIQRRIPIPPQARPQQPESEQSEDDSDDSDETIMIQPVVIPLGPANPFQTHMPQQMRPMIRPLPAQMQPQQPPQRPVPQFQVQRQIEIQIHPQPQGQAQMMHSMPVPQQIQIIPLTPPQAPRAHQAPPQVMQVPPHPIETLRPPRPEQPEPQQYTETVLPPYHVMQQIAQQILNQRLQVEAQRAQEENMRRYAAQQAAQEEARRESFLREEEARRAAAIDAARREEEARRAAMMEAAQREEARRMSMMEAQRAAQIAAAQETAQRVAQEEARRAVFEQAREEAARRAAAQEAVQRAVQETARRAIAQAAAQRAAQEAARNNVQQEDDDTKDEDSPDQSASVSHIPMMMTQQIPEEVLRQINKLPNHEVIVQVTEERPSAESEEAREIQVIPQENNGPQEVARLIPVHIPVPMMAPQIHTQEQPPQQQPEQQEPQQQQQESQEGPQQPMVQQQNAEIQEQQAVATSEEATVLRPHNVQPRSVASPVYG